MTGDSVEDTGARDGLSDRMHAVVATFEVAPPSAASLRRHAERRQTTRRALGAGVIALVAAVLLLAPDGAVTTAPTPVPPATRPSATAATPTPATPTPVAGPVPTGWGPDVPHFAVLGQPMAGAEPWPGEATVRTLTEVSTGVVYLDPTRNQVVHRGWDEKDTVIGATPWQRADQRELVGNPGHDLVAWGESVDGARGGDLVVVRASTGEELARTPVPGDPVSGVFIASIDAEAVYFATPWAHSRPGAPVPGENVWTWRWSTGAPPEDARDIADRIFDVSSGVWAVQGPRGILLKDRVGQVMLTTDHPGDKQVFGQVLSPDGRFWRNGADAVTEIATGEVLEVPGTRGMSEAAWSGLDEQIVFVDGRLKVCMYPSGACSELVEFPDADGVLPEMPTS